MELWNKELEDDLDKDFVWDGIFHGFQLIPADADLKPAEMDNYKSVTNVATCDAVEDTLLEEIREGNYVVTDNKPTVVSAIGAINKPDLSEVHLIHDCSQLEGLGVNTDASVDEFSFQSIEDAIKLLGPEYYMAKIDLRHAYCSIPIHPSSYRATGLKWKFKSCHKVTYFIDTWLPFRGGTGPGIFHRISQSVRRMMEHRGFGLLSLSSTLTIF